MTYQSWHGGPGSLNCPPKPDRRKRPVLYKWLADAGKRSGTFTAQWIVSKRIVIRSKCVAHPDHVIKWVCKRYKYTELPGDQWSVNGVPGDDTLFVSVTSRRPEIPAEVFIHSGKIRPIKTPIK